MKLFDNYKDNENCLKEYERIIIKEDHYGSLIHGILFKEF